ncbi:MAG: carboxypeptidase-like regulatory domain-containing protein [Gammaproteobacteria bacterium]
MPTIATRNFVLVAVASGLLVACGGGGSGGGGDDGGGTTPPPAVPVTISGRATFDLVPHDRVTGALDFASTFREPVRGATVQLVDASNGVLATGVTDDSGRYAVDTSSAGDLRIRILAERRRAGAPGWNTRVADNTASGSPTYALETPVFQTGGADVVRDVHAPSGWDGGSYAGPRLAAPFALLDAVREAEARILQVAPETTFPALQLNWSPANTPSSVFVPFSGRIVTTFYDIDVGGRIWVLGDEAVDTDEFDRHVIIHEWSHYYEDNFSRVDSPGGRHSRSARHDLRVAFSEGWGNAFAAMAQDDPDYVDTARPGSSLGIFRFLVGSPSPVPGWYSEASVERLLWNFYDAANDGLDVLTLGYGPIDAVLRGPQRNTRAQTSIYTFIGALKAAEPARAAAIDALAEAENIVSSGQDIWGSAETNDAGRDHVLPLYTEVFVDGPAVNVCSVATSTIDVFNRIGNRRLLRFTAASAGRFAFEVRGSAGSDPDLVIWNGGEDSVAESRLDGIETREQDLPAGEHVLEVYDYRNIDPGATDVPGTYCFDVTVRRVR